MKIKGNIIFLTTLFWIISNLVLSRPAIAEVCNRIVACVNSDIITLHELNSKIKEMTGVSPFQIMNENKEKYLQTRSNILQILIDEKITHEKVKELGIEISSLEIDKEIERIKKEHALTHEELLNNLKEKGLTYEALRRRIKKDIERMQLTQFEVNSKIVVSDEEIEEYYNEHKEEFKNENRVRLASIILLQQDPSDKEEALSLAKKADVIMSRLKNGHDFATLANQFTEGPGAGEGGDLGLFEIASLSPELKDIVDRMPTGEVSQPLVRSFGIQIIKIVEKQEQGVKPIDEVKDMISRKLYRLEVNKRYSSWIKELRDKAYTKIIF